MKSSNLESLESNATKAPDVWDPTQQGLCGSDQKDPLMLKLEREVNLAKFQ